MPARFIHFFGPDGAGKSTQVNLLVDYCRSRGIKVKQYWVRSPHTLAYVLWKLFVKIGFYRVINNSFGVPVKIPAVQRSRILKTFWATVELVSVMPLIARANVYLLRGYTLVAERYILDTIVTIGFFLDDSTFLRSVFSRVLLCFLPKETAFVFLDTDYETIYERRAKFYKNPRSTSIRLFNYSKPPAENLEPYSFIDFQRKMYTAFANYYPSLRIDTSKNSIEETFRKVQTYIAACDCEAVT